MNNNINFLILETIPIITGPTISEFERFVRFHQPFVVKQSHRIWAMNEIAQFLLETPQLANSIPCDTQTNIHTSPSARLNQIFEHTVNNLQFGKWFFAFRNCDFTATKSTRPLWPRPTFIPLHLRPYHTSWLIVASGYPDVDTKSLEVRGLAAIVQLTGRRFFQLLGSGSECEHVCPKLSIELWAGETLVFLADMWRIRYAVSAGEKGDDGMYSVTYVAEFDFDEERW